MRILVTDGMDKTAMAQLREAGHEVVEQFYEPDQLGAALREFDAVVVRSKTKVRANHIDEAKGLGMNARTAIIAIVTALVLAAVALLANRAAKGKGSVKLFGKTVKVFPAKFSATALYVACTVLGCCLVACLVLGSALFAYYCMFAAIAIELTGAVYYTFQLK